VSSHLIRVAPRFFNQCSHLQVTWNKGALTITHQWTKIKTLQTRERRLYLVQVPNQCKMLPLRSHLSRSQLWNSNRSKLKEFRYLRGHLVFQELQSSIKSYPEQKMQTPQTLANMSRLKMTALVLIEPTQLYPYKISSRLNSHRISILMCLHLKIMLWKVPQLLLTDSEKEEQIHK